MASNKHELLRNMRELMTYAYDATAGGMGGSRDYGDEVSAYCLFQRAEHWQGYQIVVLQTHDAGIGEVLEGIKEALEKDGLGAHLFYEKTNEKGVGDQYSLQLSSERFQGRLGGDVTARKIARLVLKYRFDPRKLDLYTPMEVSAEEVIALFENMIEDLTTVPNQSIRMLERTDKDDLGGKVIRVGNNWDIKQPRERLAALQFEGPESKIDAIHAALSKVLTKADVCGTNPDFFTNSVKLESGLGGQKTLTLNAGAVANSLTMHYLAAEDVTTYLNTGRLR
ncbi:MAG: hypothetical protein H6908_00365 [Hyphomicrobiales bacterium]|nr:hypothetical protein [Rickettsiales bacterium]MCP5361084.1 hypothetical protein [Hyphomicrobiales bacterium]